MFIRSFKAAKTSSTELLLESEDCYAIPAESLFTSSKQTWSKIRYDVERFVPLDAEGIAITSTHHSLQGSVDLFIACNADQLNEQVLKLESSGSWISAVTPKSTLLLQHWLEKQKTKVDGEVCIANQNNWDWFQVRSSRPLQWRWLSGEQLTEHFQSLNSLDQVRVLGTETQLASVLSAFPSLSDQGQVIDTEVELAQASSSVRLGHLRPWFDFRQAGIRTQSPLRPIAFALTALGMVLNSAALGIATLFFANGLLVSQEALRLRELQTEKFQELFPNQSVPSEIAGRLRNEFRKLTDMQTQWSDGPVVESATSRLVDVVNSFPENAVFRVDSMRAQSAALQTVTGSVRSYEDLIKIQEVLRANSFVFSPPKTQQMLDGFSLRLEAIRKPATEGNASKTDRPNRTNASAQEPAKLNTMQSETPNP